MNWTIYQGAILIIWLLIGLSLMVFANRTVKWMWAWSVKLWGKIGALIGRSDELGEVEQQPQAPVWMIRIFGFLAASMALYLFMNNFIIQHLTK